MSTSPYEIESNSEGYAEKRDVAISGSVRKFLSSRVVPGDIAPLAPMTS